MSEKVRIATFNAENLFARYRFRQNINPFEIDGFTANQLAFNIYDEASKRITAEAIDELKADVIALQEVESLPVLDRFNSRYLAGKGYKHRIVIDAFDPRQIDVAVLSKYPIDRVKSFRNTRNEGNTAFIFSRDCLEVEVNVNDKPLVLYVNHFKSMIPKRSETKERRQKQVEKVAEIINDEWADKKYKGNFVVLGDFNDYIDDDTSLTALVTHPGLENVLKRIPEGEDWTHYWNGGDKYSQLDFILLSKSLAEKNNDKPVIMRKGLPYRANKYQGDRFSQVGEDEPKASDHCPVYMDIVLD